MAARRIKFKQQIKTAKARLLADSKEYVLLCKSSGCLRCGESHPACLDFHHRDPASKIYAVTDATRFWKLEKLAKEIEKCDVLCANCHRILHWDERQTS